MILYYGGTHKIIENFLKLYTAAIDSLTQYRTTSIDCFQMLGYAYTAHIRAK
jgi:hypothetical protein